MNIVTRLCVSILLITLSSISDANCRTEIGYVGPNQIGHILLFSSRGGGPWHATLKSDFWAISEPTNMVRLLQFAVSFAPAAQAIVDSWDWSSIGSAPQILRVLADGVLNDRGQSFTLHVREIFYSYAEFKQALAKYPDAHRGTCGSYFSRR